VAQAESASSPNVASAFGLAKEERDP
jgi:hypothetical protein